MGKYSVDRTHPILVKLNSSCDVSVILSNKRSLSSSSGVYIRPDLTPAQKFNLNILLKERRSLLSSGYQSRDIKISNNSIFIQNSLYGKVVNKSFVRFNDSHSNLSDDVSLDPSTSLLIQHSPPRMSNLTHQLLLTISSSFSHPCGSLERTV